MSPLGLPFDAEPPVPLLVAPAAVGGYPAWQQLVRERVLVPLWGSTAVPVRTEVTAEVRAQAIAPLVPAGTVVAGPAAAWVLCGVGPPQTLDVIYPPGVRRPALSTRVRSRQGTVLHTERLTLAGVQITVALRTALDVAGRLPQSAAVAILRTLQDDLALDLAHAARSLELRYRWPQRAQARAALAAARASARPHRPSTPPRGYREGMASADQAVHLDIDGRDVRVTSPDRMVFPDRGLTKLDVVRYFMAVGDGIVGALVDRPTTLERWPKGFREDAKRATRTDPRGDAFYQKRVPAGAPAYVRSATISFPSGRTADEVCPDELAVVVWAANLGTLTFHPWPVRSGDVERPDQLRIDLDPQPGTDYADAARVAPHLREILGELGLTGWPKTSGGRGLHVFVPIAPRWTFVEARRATIAIGRELERRLPDQVTTKWWKEERGARIFVDYNQMARDRTIASAYSVRANSRATVSAPLRWDEVGEVRPDDFDVTTMPGRFAEVGDLFAALRADRPDDGGSLDAALDLSRRDEAEHDLGDLPYPPEYPKMPGEPKRVQPSRDRNRTAAE